MNNQINLYVDDLRDCPEGFVLARTYDEAIHLLETKESNEELEFVIVRAERPVRLKSDCKPLSFVDHSYLPIKCYPKWVAFSL
ncbi:cyclic-phosphate processing receiver domain-containing protein [Paenibacillus sp. N3.4]|uniref:cyclic-phosphate processing receiver domain-containing protein n=1 Tax=Paenibacillus sp. N3.4 TaxID=2603222 RepID=UPI0011CB1A97|nr:cyclic-phosphate processing receiver domain-containing protein [Paenibacillus sp. N3.4]TXK83440.1 hypothetical protein FU659_13705 [Paenibacillus sp. N3.4]